MYPTIKNVMHMGDYRLLLSFDTGEVGLIDLAEDVANGNGVFRPLANIAYFKQVRVDNESGTIVWPNGVDLDPIGLYEDSTRVGSDTLANFVLNNILPHVYVTADSIKITGTVDPLPPLSDYVGKDKIIYGDVVTGERKEKVTEESKTKSK